MANDPVQCCGFDIGCAGTDTALWQLFCQRGLVFFVFQHFYSQQCSAKSCQSFGVKRPKNRLSEEAAVEHMKALSRSR